MKKALLIIVLLTPVILFAQRQRTGNLTVFSEDGDKFYLVLNGEKQNDIPQTNIRIEELPQPYYSARIMFADSTIVPISKNNLMIADADGIMMDVTYKIRIDKSRKPKMNFFSMIPVEQDFVPPSGMYVRHYGQPVRVTDGVTQTTTTTTTTNTVGATINVPGVNVNVSITDPIDSYSTTTSTTTSNSSSNQPQSSSRNCNGWPMKAGDFSAAKKTITDASYDETKLSTAKSIVAANCVSTDQVIQLCSLFSFEDSKLDFAKYAYKYTTDQKNYFKVNNVFSFSASKEELNSFISGND